MLSEQPTGRTGNTNTGSLPVRSSGATIETDAVTKSTLKTLWLTGGGLLAGWLAVTPQNAAPARVAATAVDRPAVVRELMSDDLNAREGNLRRHRGAVPLGPTSRNPFRFGAKPANDAHQQPASEAVSTAASGPVPRPELSLSLSGIAERRTPQGRVRTAIISGDGQLYLVTDGESVGGRYTVVTVDPEAVVLRDETGAETRLTFH